MSQDRISPLPRSELNPEKQAAYDHIDTTLTSYFGPEPIFKTKDKAGAFIGPIAPAIQYPVLAKPQFDMLSAIGKLSTLSADARETTILTVGGVYKCAYELYCHVRVAASQTALTQTQIERLAKAEKPDQLSQECDIAFEVTLALASGKGPLKQELWNRGVDVLGQVGLVALVQFVGFYAYTCITLNAVDASVPEDGS